MDTSKKKKISTNQKKKKEHKNKTLKLELGKKKRRSPCAHMGSRPREKKPGSYHLFPLSLSLSLFQSNAIQKNFPPHLPSFFFPHPPKNPLYQTHP